MAVTVAEAEAVAVAVAEASMRGAAEEQIWMTRAKRPRQRQKLLRCQLEAVSITTGIQSKFKRGCGDIKAADRQVPQGLGGDQRGCHSAQRRRGKRYIGEGKDRNREEDKMDKYVEKRKKTKYEKEKRKKKKKKRGTKSRSERRGADTVAGIIGRGPTSSVR